MSADLTWYTPEEAAPLLHSTTREVRELCASDQIDHRRKVSPGGRTRYLISLDAIQRYVSRTTRRAKSGRGAA